MFNSPGENFVSVLVNADSRKALYTFLLDNVMQGCPMQYLL